MQPMEIANQLLAEGRTQEAYVYLQTELAHSERQFEVQSSCATLEWNYGHPQLARERLRRLFEQPERSFSEQLILAETLVNWGLPFEAMDLMAKALDRRKATAASERMDSVALMLSETCSFGGLRALGGLLDYAETVPATALKRFFLKLLPQVWTQDENWRLRDLYRRYDESQERAVEAMGQRFAPWDRLNGPEIVVGFLGSLSVVNSTAKFLLPVLPYLKGRGFRMRYYSTVQPVPGDPAQAELAATMESMAWLHEASPQAIAQQVYADGCTMLIDLDGHSRFSKTEAFVFRPAPIQVSWVNWPSSLGLASADYFLVDRYLIPPDSSLLSETAVAMGAPWGCFTPLAEAAVVSELPCVRNGHITFGNASSPYKLNARLIRLWAEVLRRVPEAKFRLIRHECADEGFRANIVGEFQRYGIAPERLEFFDFRGQGLSHLEAYGGLDICLDSAPFGGATTAADCLWMGVPLISLVGPGVHQRLSYSILASIGAEELAVGDEVGYVECAVGLAADPARIAAYRASLRGRFEASSLRDPQAVADEVVAAFGAVLEDARGNLAARLAR